MKQYKPRDKITQKMTRDGLTEQNQTTGESERISKRIQEADFQKTPEQEAAQLQGAASPPSPLPHAPGTAPKQDTAAAERVMEHIGAAHTRKASKKAARKALEEAGKRLDPDMIFYATSALPDRLRQALQAGKHPDAFLIHSPDLREETVRLLQEFQIDFQQQCRLISGSAAMKIPGFAGWCHEQPYQEIGEAATELLLRLFAGDSRIEHRTLVTKHFSVNLK